MYTTCRFTGKKLLKPGLKLIGGKTKSRDVLYTYRPEQCNHYIEPFLGSGSILIGIDPPFEQEAASDINYSLIRYYLTLQNHPEELFHYIQLFTKSIEQYEDGSYWKWLRDNEYLFINYAVSHAAWFYCVTKYAMNGIYRRNKSGVCNSSWCKTTKGRGIFSQEWFWKVYNRVVNVEFKHMDYREAIREADSSTWVILDSPYYDNKTVYNGDRWDTEDFIEYAKILAKCPAKQLITINDHPFIRNLFKEYKLIENPINYSVSQTLAGRGIHQELILLNY